ncbi:hypothetical protein Y032_0012g1599 [Ancylostoma ceylanicum]|uniref:Uncharacterized protein n=1 Tax=Ancylostoma ceylanicum TaxID=53326 RepID=A0A016VCF7_9BILA|nr:hypothetical protein Y032_0012g1599 [Ancylostoma ceylanicum]
MLLIRQSRNSTLIVLLKVNHEERKINDCQRKMLWDCSIIFCSALRKAAPTLYHSKTCQKGPPCGNKEVSLL